MGYRIFILCLRQLLNSVGEAFQLSWFWLALYVGVDFAFWAAGGHTYLISMVILEQHAFFDTGVSPRWLFLTTLYPFVSITVSAIGFPIIAIGWHRFVLRDKTPSRFYEFHWSWPIGRYIWNSIKIAIAISIALIPMLFLVAYPLFTMIDPSILADKAPGFVKVFLYETTLFLIFGVYITWLFLRMGIILPALAVGKRMALRDAFRLTTPISGQLAISAFWVLLLQLAPYFIQSVLFQFADPTSTILHAMMLITFTIFWIISFFVGFGILTVIYGHLAEGKPI